MFKRGRHGHLTLRQLETFEAIARLGSVTRAAEALHLSQPAVSIQLRSLAEAVGQRLTEPAGRGLRLTQAGHDLYEACSEMAAVWSRFESQLDEVAALRRGRLRVSVVTTAKYFLPRALGLFVQQHPGIDVELEILNRDGVLARLRDRLDDLHVMSAPPLEWSIDAEPFLDNPLVVIAPRGFRPPKPGELRLADLAAERFLLRESGSGTRMLVDQALARERVRLARRMTVGSNEAIKQAVAGGLGLSVLSRHAVSEADLPEIRILAVRGFPLASAWHVVHWHDAHLSAPAEAFRRYLLHFAAELRGSPAVIGSGARPPRARGGPARGASPRRARNP
jgi:DNA-binding transcriptional LysR family regulator